jgi:hypothetical protein
MLGYGFRQRLFQIFEMLNRSIALALGGFLGGFDHQIRRPALVEAFLHPRCGAIPAKRAVLRIGETTSGCQGVCGVLRLVRNQLRALPSTIFYFSVFIFF